MDSESPVPADATAGGAGDLNALGSEIRSLLSRFVAVARVCRDEVAVLAALADCQRIASAASAAEVHLLAGMIGELADFETVPDEVAVELGWGLDRARNRMDEAVALATRLPAVLRALEDGRIDSYKASLFAERTHALDPEKAAEVAESVLGRVEGKNPASVAQMLRHAVARIDPEGCARRHQIERTKRRVVLYPKDDEMAELRAYLPADAAIAIYRRVDAVAHGARVAGDERTMDAQRADALVNLLLGRRDPGTGAEPDAGFRPLLQVTVAATTLMGLDDKPGQLEGYGPVTAEFARRLAKDRTSWWRRFITDERGRLVAVGRTYRPPASLDRFVRLRDRTCRFPGCRRSARRADLDHTIPWPKGPTTAGNLGVLCRRHHRWKALGLVRVEQHDGTFYWVIVRTGRRYAVEPENHDPP